MKKTPITLTILELIRTFRKSKLLISFVIVMILFGCKNPVQVALETNDPQQGISAIEKIYDQEMIARIASEANNIEVRVAAVNKLTDQSLLEDIVTDFSDSIVSYTALNKLTDQNLLASIARFTKNSGIRQSVIGKLTDQSRFKIIMEADSSDVKMAALKSITDQILLAKIAMDTKDSLISQTAVNMFSDPYLVALRQALKKAPAVHRNRLMFSVIPGIIKLMDPDITSQFGEIVTINSSWSPRKKYYSFGNFQYRIEGFNMTGENFKCSIKLKNLAEPLSYTWSTDFPDETSKFEFLPAEIDAGNLLEPVFEKLSQEALLKIIAEDEYSNIRIAAFKKIKNQLIIEKIAIENSDWIVRQFALESITDTSLITKIAMEDEMAYVRISAISKITDQNLLFKIFLKDEDYLVREKIIQILTDQSLLARIASSEENGWTLQNDAIRKLNDKSLLTKISLEDKDEIVRNEAKDRLNTLNK